MTPVKQAIWKSMGMLLPWQSGYASVLLWLIPHARTYLLQRGICEAPMLYDACAFCAANCIPGVLACLIHL